MNTCANADDKTNTAGQAWSQGDIETAYKLAQQQYEHNPDTESTTLLIKTLVLNGRYQQALTVFQAMTGEARQERAIFPFIMQAYTELGRFADAADFAEAANQPDNVQVWWRQRAEHPLTALTKDMSVIPFSKQNPLAVLMPAIDVLINGRPMLAHLDTGGAYLAMSPQLAESLGIQTIEVGRGYANDQETAVHNGLVDSLVFGAAELTNIPTVALPALSGVLQGQDIEDMIILGTKALAHFLVTWDNDKGRLIVSPRGDQQAHDRHFAQLAGERENLPFYYYPDHLMLAAGQIRQQPALWFIDTGLVTIDGNGNQPGAGMSKKALTEFGFDSELEEGQFVYPDDPISLGPLSETDLSIRVFGDRFAGALPGIRVAGLLGHGFLKHYNWTLDFDRHQLSFTRVTAVDESRTAPAPVTTDQGSDYSGSYEVVPGVDLVISFADDRLYLQAPGQQPVPITPTDTDRFEIAAAGAVIVFERNDSGAVSSLQLHQGSNITSARKK